MIHIWWMIKCIFLKLSFLWNFHNKIVWKFSLAIFGRAKKDCVTETRETFSFVLVINNAVTIGLSSLFLSISAIILSSTIKNLQSLQCFKPAPLYLLTKIAIVLHVDPENINKFYKRTVCDLLNFVMHLFFLIQNLWLLIFCMDYQELLSLFRFCPFVVFCSSIKANIGILIYYYI